MLGSASSELAGASAVPPLSDAVSNGLSDAAAGVAAGDCVVGVVAGGSGVAFGAEFGAAVGDELVFDAVLFCDLDFARFSRSESSSASSSSSSKTELVAAGDESSAARWGAKRSSSGAAVSLSLESVSGGGTAVGALAAVFLDGEPVFAAAGFCP